MSAAARQMSLAAFVQAQNCSVYTGSWRHPASATDFLAPEFYHRIARVLEDGCFDLLFFDDRLAMPDIYGGDHRETVAHGIRPVKLDPCTVLMTMASVTSRIGLGATYSTTYYQPYHVARLFASIDMMTRGRAAWNIVTSVNDSEAANFGVDEHLEHDLRYDKAEEFLQVVTGHWNSWDDGAILMDKTEFRFGDPDKVHRLNHVGPYFKSRGPLTVPRSPQGQPVLLQAGQSGRGLEFASRWADMIFALYPSHETGRTQYRSIKNAIAAAGRDPDSVKVAPALRIIVGETATQAQDRRDFTDSFARPIDTLALLCEVMNVDFAKLPYEEPLSSETLASFSMQGMRDRILERTGKSNPTLRDFVEFSGRGTLREGPTFVGTPSQVADEMEAWFADACDGFVLYGTTVPGTYEDVVRLVVPELQRRGLFRTSYPGSTLRDTLDLQRPASRIAAA